MRKSPARKELESSVIYLGMHGFHAHTIEERLGCSRWMVYSICHKAGVHLRDYRDGKNEIAERVISRTPAIRHRMVKKIREELHT